VFCVCLWMLSENSACILPSNPVPTTPQSGSRFLRTLTFANTATADLKFRDSNILVVDPKNPPPTTLWLEFGKDGSTSPLDPGLPNNVSFTLKKDGVNMLSFALNSLPNKTPVPEGNAMPEDQITMDQPKNQQNQPISPGLYTLTIGHLQNVDINGETWELVISNLPTGGSPVLRLNATLDDANDGFSDLTPTGQCTQ